MISDTGRAPCLIRIDDAGIELRADSAGRVTSVGLRAFRGVRGQYYTYTGNGEITLWSASGRFVSSFGHEGQGPGEFARGPVQIHVNPAGEIYVRDNNARWSVFSASNAFQYSVSALGMGFDVRETSFLENGHFLSASAMTEQPQFFFQVYDFQARDRAARDGSPRGGGSLSEGPRLVQSFAPVPPGERALPRDALSRLISYAGRSTFWAGPPRGSGRGYELELWNLNGTRQRTISRVVSWFPRSARVPQQQQGGSATPPAPPPELITLHDDGSGLLFTCVRVTNDSWAAFARLRDRAERRAAQGKVYDVYCEVIDADAGVVLATTGPVSAERIGAEFPHGFFSRSRQGYRYVQDADGYPAQRIVEYRLVAK